MDTITSFELAVENSMIDLMIDSEDESEALELSDATELVLPSVDRSMILLNDKLSNLKVELERLKFYLKDLDDSFSP